MGWAMKASALCLLLAAAAAPAARAEDGTWEGKDAKAWTEILTGKDAASRPRAAAALARIGRPAVDALPDLVKALAGSAREEDLRVNAALALGYVAGERYPSRFSAGDSPPRMPGDPLPGGSDGKEGNGEDGGAGEPKPAPVRTDPAAEALAEMVERKVVPALVKALRDPCADVRTNAALSLSRLGAAASPATASLVKSLGDRVRAVRRNAVVALASCDPEPKAVLGPLAKALADDDAVLANGAANALASLGAEALPALGDLREALKRDCAKPRTAMDFPLGGGGGRAGIPETPTLTCNLCLALGKMGKAAAPALPEVFLALGAKNLPARNAALRTVSDIRSDPEASVAAVIPLLKDPAPEVRSLAPLVLSDFGPDARSALPALEALLEDPDPTVAQNARSAIDRIGGKAVATGDGAVAPESPAGMTLYGGMSGGTTEVWR